MRKNIKRIAVVLAAAVLAVLCSVRGFATDGSSHSERNINVTAKSVYNIAEGCYDAEEDGGNYTVKLPDNTEIEVKPKSPDPVYRLVIHPITEKDGEAYRWLSRSISNLGSGILFYDIYFVDEYGTRVDINTESDVSIILPENYGLLKIASVSADGTVLHLNSNAVKNRLSFTINQGGYYAVAVPTASGYDNSPKTGYTDNSGLWLTLLFASESCLVFGIILRCRKNMNKF